MTLKNAIAFVKQEFSDSAKIQEILKEKFSELVATTGIMMIDCLKNGGKLMICGNGGSASDAQHFAAEMIGRLKRNREPIPAIALTTDTAILTAVGNDFAFDAIFTRQVQALGQKDDILVVLSTSGQSPNLIHAIEAAQAKGMKTIALLGKGGGRVAEMADYDLVVPGHLSQRIQEGHITIIHIWCDLIEDTLYPVDDQE